MSGMGMPVIGHDADRHPDILIDVEKDLTGKANGEQQPKFIRRARAR